MNKRLIEKLNGETIGVSDGTGEEMAAHKLLRQEASPESTFEEIDTTAEVEAAKAKEEKKKNFQFKGATIAALRAELNEWLEMQK